MVERFKGSEIKYLLAYENKYVVNESFTGCTNLPEEHSFTDIKQIILANVIDIAKANRNRVLYINSLDVDLAILLTGLFNHIPPQTIMKSNGAVINVMDLYNRLGDRISESIIGWYSFNGKKFQLLN